MTLFDYAAQGFAVPGAIQKSHRDFWHRLAGPGSWWTGAERIEIARLSRAARAVRQDPPWLRDGTPASSDLLPERAADVVRRVAADVHLINRDWARETASQLGDAAYVEICAIAACMTAIDAFADALGLPLEPLPDPCCKKGLAK